MKKCRKFAWLGLGLLAAIGIVCSMGCHRKSPEEKVAYASQKLASKLDLNEQQKQKLDVVASETLELMKAMKADRESVHDTVIAELSSEQADSTKLQAIYEQRRDAVDAKVPGIIESFSELHASLNTEQKQELLEWMEKFKKYRR